MSVIFSHPTGNANVRAAAKGLVEAELLSEFHTTIAAFPKSLLDRFGGFRPLSELRRRRFSSDLRPFSNEWPWYEVCRLLASKAKLTSLTKHENGVFSVDAVYRSLDRQVSKGILLALQKGAQAIYAYEDGALASFNQAKEVGLQRFYDLPTGYWRAARRLLKEENENWPEWASTMQGLTDSETKLFHKDEELRLANRIFVASTFVANTLKEYPGKLPPIEIIPYGFPAVGKEREYTARKAKQKLKLLFVGKLTQQKGVANLFAAVEPFKDWVDLTLVGHKGSSSCPALDAALINHQWFPTLPHESVLELMRAHDVLVFPSLFDGFGLVITEAMSQGTPVITTERSAGPDLIIHEQNGWLIEAGSTLAIQHVLEQMLSNPAIIARVGKAAWEKASSRPWKMYSNELASAIQKHLTDNANSKPR